MPHPIGKIKKVALREIWRREATDFTTWLAEHIDYLNEVIDLDITVQTTEGNVGPYRVDIYGEDGAGKKVIIENQLEKTDHTHLGQILTYMVNLDANVAIWITANPVEEHRRVVEWLNETTPDDMRFYLIRIEGIRIGDAAEVAPLFTVVEGPTQERKQIGAAKKEHAHAQTVRQAFWTQFLDAINKKSPLCENISPGTGAWFSIALGVSGITVNVVATKNHTRTEIYINRGTPEKNKDVFDRLLKQKAAIEEQFGNPLVWERMEDRVTSRIKYQLDGVNVSNEADWPKMHDFMTDAAVRMHAAFKVPVRSLKLQLTK